MYQITPEDIENAITEMGYDFEEETGADLLLFLDLNRIKKAAAGGGKDLRDQAALANEAIKIQLAVIVEKHTGEEL